MLVGSTSFNPAQGVTIQPGQTVQVQASFSMHSGMGGMHNFEWTVISNDPTQPPPVLAVNAEYPKP